MIDKARISVFLPSLRGGGAEKALLNLANDLEQEGHTVNIILAQKEGPLLAKVNKNIKIVDLRSKRVLFALLPLVRYLREEQTDILLSAMPHANVTILLAKIISCRKPNVIVVEQNNFSLEQNTISLFKRTVLRFFVKKLYHRAKAVVAVSNGVAMDLVKNIGISKKNLHVIFNPVNLSEIKKKMQSPTPHPWLEQEIPVVLSVGRLTYQKDFPTLIKAFKIVRDKKQVNLIILGEGAERKNLEKLIRKLNLERSVFIPGFTDNPYAYMSKADLFVLSSIYEGLATVLIEAMACGTPIVSTDCPSGPSEILENGKYGKLVPVGDANALAKAITETLANPIDSETLRRKANCFSSDKSIKKYMEIMGLMKYNE